MNKEIKVSVIIPVYNASNYLEQCLDSVADQTLKEIEIICVDDGSTDDSPMILKRYADQDGRFLLLKQQNQYAGVARNTGMKEAKGKYLVFWDADDYFKPEALEKMYKQCEADDADICVCGGRQYYQDIELEVSGSRYLRKKDMPKQIPFNIETDPDGIISFTCDAPWNKMFRRQFIEKHQLQFKPIRNTNDAFFVENALCLADRVTIVNEELVCYRRSKMEGLVATADKALLTSLQTWVDIADSLKEKGRFPERSFANRSLESVIYLLNNAADWEAFKKGFEFLRDGNLEKMNIRYDVPEDYYYIGFHREAAERLYNDSPEQYSRWMSRLMYQREDKASARVRSMKEKEKNNKEKISRMKTEIADLKKTVSSLRQEIRDLRGSLSFKIGRLITWLPRKLKKLLKGKKNV
ncbi:MAG: glycosyltransferase family 2 protein [Erysipelotrichaceae bacterium]|nr:glycosyltransferase family 2 protein [Erysipelotrichaceae bacterium]